MGNKKTPRHGNNRKNNFLSRMVTGVDGLMQEAFAAGFQQACDLLALALHDHDVMGKDIYGARRIYKVYQGILKHEDRLHGAWTAGQDASDRQAELDAELRAIFERRQAGVIVPFGERYSVLARPRQKSGKQ